MFPALICALALTVAAAKADSREDPTVANTMHRIVGSVVDSDAGTVARETRESQGMKVVNIGMARTGTSSFVTAMRDLGLLSYHMKDGVQDTPGHMDLWLDHAALAFPDGTFNQNWRSDRAMTLSREKLFDQMAADGFNATADMPMNAYYRELLERYPKALVVLTEHHSGSADRWAQSVMDTIGQNPVLFRKRPWSWIPMVAGFLNLNEWCWDALGYPAGGDGPQPPADKHSLHPTKLADTYRQCNADAESWLKQKQIKVLKFKATDGWGPLCNFLSPALGDASVDAKCAAILASGVPFPKANADLRTVYAVLNAITAIFQLPIALLVTLPLGGIWLMYKLFIMCCGRPKSDKKDKAA